MLARSRRDEEAPDGRADALPAAAVREPRAEVRCARRDGSTCACSPRRADGSPSDATLPALAQIAGRSTAPAFYVTLPFRVASELRRFGPTRSSTQSPYEAIAVVAGRGLARRDAALIVELHGDWRTSRGSTARRFAARSRRRPTAWRRGRCAVRTPCAHCRHTRPASRARPASSRRRSSSPSPTSRHSLTRRLRRSRRRPRRCSSACSSATRTSTTSPPRGGSSRSGCPEARLRLVGQGHRRDVVERARRASCPSTCRGRRR